MRRMPLRGFTLLELLVVMALLSIIMVGLVSSLRTMAQTELRIDQRLQKLDEVRVARAFLQQTLTRISASLMDAPGALGKKVVSFSATPQSLTWVGIFPARPNVGGRYYFRLAVEDDGAEPGLVLRFFPWNPDMVYPAWSTAQARVLIVGIKRFNVEAEGAQPQGRNSIEPWPVGWQNGWSLTDALPERLRINLEDVQGGVFAWTIPLYPLVQSDGSVSSVSVGGSQP